MKIRGVKGKGEKEGQTHLNKEFKRIAKREKKAFKRLFNTSVSLLLSHIQSYHYHLSKFHIYIYIYTLVYCIGVFLSDLLHSV